MKQREKNTMKQIEPARPSKSSYKTVVPVPVPEKLISLDKYN
jgi:hypothetical protein